MIEAKGERAGIAESRKHLGWYMQGLRGAAELRNKINCAENYGEIVALLESIKNIETV
jgi:tRNA-dihydrouridine synthase B